MIPASPSTLRKLVRPSEGIALLAAAILCLAMVRCGTAPTAGGGSDLPNGAVAQVWGYVAGPDSLPIENADVYLREVIITARGDSSAVELHTRSASDGWFGFDSIAPGEYALFLQSPDGSAAAVMQLVHPLGTNDTAIGPLPLVLAPRVNLEGALLLPSGYHHGYIDIFIPGTRIGVRLSANAPQLRYVLNGVPAGCFDIAIVYDNVANYLPVCLHPAPGQPDLVMRDLAFAPLEIMADTALSLHVTTAGRSYCITPVAYPAGQEPFRYYGTNFSGVDYYERRAGELVPWDSSGPQGSAAYDTVMAGVAWRDSTGRVMLVTQDGTARELRGTPVQFVDARPTGVVVAVLFRLGNGQAWLEVVELGLYSPDPWQPGGNPP